MAKQLIPFDNYPDLGYVDTSKPFLRVSEFFRDSIQGEGMYAGMPATFLRLQGCHVGCKWCDTTEVWRQGCAYSVEQLVNLCEQNKDMVLNQHFVITGGSPLLQQDYLVVFMEELWKHNIQPFFELETEGTILPRVALQKYIRCWNVSPKLSNSGVPTHVRYNPTKLKTFANLRVAWFKFVVDNETDWREIQIDFLDTSIIGKYQIILMPQGATKEELNLNRERVIEMAVRHGVRYSDRLQIVAWDKKIGV